MTLKLYEEQPYQKQTTAKVVRVLPSKDVPEKSGEKEKGEALFEVELDRTLFYPEGGGQPCDMGWIDGHEVVYVREEGGRVFHQMKEAPSQEEVKLQIDWQRRYDHMQQHTGEHVVSGLFLQLYGADNKGFHLGEHYVTVDIDLPHISQAMLEAVETAANEAIWGNRGIRCDVTTREGLENFPIRKKITAEGSLRIVTIQDIDCCACCGTHVATLAEVGVVKLIKTESYKGMTRVYLISGKRALADYRKKSGVLQNLRQFYSTEEKKLLEAGEKLRGELSQAKKELQSSRKSLAQWILEATSRQEPIGVWQVEEGVEVLVALEEQIKKQWSEKAQRLAVSRAILLSRTEYKIIAFSQNPQDEIGAFFKTRLMEFGGKGGGSKERAQASFQDLEGALAFVAAWREAYPVKEEMMDGSRA